MAILRYLILFLPLLALPARGAEVAREKKGFPRCVENVAGKNLFLKYSKRSLSRVIRYNLSTKSCSDWRRDPPRSNWKVLDEQTKALVPESLRWELEQIALKTEIFREERTAAEFVDRRNITEYTRELNRELTPKYGPVFSAMVFKELVERKPRNKEFRQYVLSELNKPESQETPFAEYRKDVKLVVSFGLGWSHTFGLGAPVYIRDFLSDIESLGLDVVYLDKNPFGTIEGNVRRMTPQLEEQLKDDRKIILLSLCKGTPELLSALKSSITPETREKIIGHVNLSGMLTGTFFADIARSIFVPRLLSPFLKIFPIKAMQNAAKMAEAATYMKTSIVSETLSDVRGVLSDDTMTVNVTGAPMSNRIMESKSLMAPILKYNSWQKFLVSANDGFIELPHTEIPEELAPRQVSLILDASHMLSDGHLDQHSIGDEATRRKLYQAILRFILKNS